MSYRVLPIFFLFLLSFKSFNEKKNKTSNLSAANAEASLESKIKDLYSTLEVGMFQVPSSEVFSKAVEGYFQLKEEGKITKDILTIIDFSLSSTQKRLWIIDMAANKVLMQSVVAHGRNSGLEFATQFSNISNSNMSSLGFYATGETYNGKHGLSLRLDGLEKGVNDNARSRAVVMHGADYASESVIKSQGRLGRSQGCPAIPFELHKEIINLVKDKSCLYIYHPSRGEKGLARLVS